MAVEYKDVLEAIKTIQNYCDEFNAKYNERMEPLKGDDITALSNDREHVKNITGHIKLIRTYTHQITFKE